MLVKFVQNRMVQTTQNFEIFDQKLFFFTNVDAILGTFLQLTQLFNAKL